MSEPIRVLQVVTHMNRGGLETMIMNYYRKINKSKVQFDFLTHRPESEKKDYDDEIRSMGGNIYHIGTLNPFSCSYKSELKTFFQSHPEYKVIHVHQDCMSSVILKVAKECGINVRIAHCHSSNQDKNIKYLVKLVYKNFIPTYATSMISCGKKAGEWMFGKNAKFLVLPNAIDTNRYAFSQNMRNTMRQELGFNDDDIVLGHVGRFCEVKNHTFILKLFKCIHDQDENYKLVFVGNGELFDEIKKEADELGLFSFIQFLGLRSDVPNLLQAMDVFLLPSLYEGLPVSIVEAQAAGLKCYISDKVPTDCSLTDLVKQISLDSSVEDWANEIMKERFVNRSEYKEIIVASGYDIEKNATFLENYYISNYECGD